MSEMVKYLETLEGEFESSGSQWDNVLSGYLCRKCLLSLLVGCAVCPRCQWRFNLPTPPREMVEQKERRELQSSWLHERTTAEEVARLQELRRKRR